MGTLFYHYDQQGSLILNYRDDTGKHIEMRYVFYTFREALQKFRKDFDMRYKHIEIKKLY